MNFLEYAAQIKSFGREINLEAIVQTRDLITPMLKHAPFDDVNIVRDISYGDDERHRLDIFTPAEGFTPEKPLLVFVHGGGFTAGDKHTPDTPFYDNIGTWAVRNGFNAINMTYRLAPEFQWPSGLEDIHKAIQFIKHSGAAHGVSGDKIFLMGQSAGGTHSSAYVAHPELYTPDKHGLKGLVLLSGIYDFRVASISEMEKAYLGADESIYVQASSIEGLLATDLPLLVTACENDPSYFEAQALGLLSALQKQRQSMPQFVHLKGQNHMSVALYLGLEGDMLAPQLKSFIEEHS